MSEEIAVARGPDDIEAARALFREYLETFRDRAGFCFRGFDAEIAALPGDYAPPRGRLLLLRVDGAAAGCIAFRPLPDGSCEMKRLWVSPRHRRLGAGRKLALRLIAEARGLGYPRMRLDTLPDEMPEAAALYRSIGFVEIPPYLEKPNEGAIAFELDLAAPR